MPGAPPAVHASSAVELKERLEAERAGEPFLVYRRADGGQCLQLLGPDRARLSVGRDPGSDVALPWDGEVSRLHAELERVGRSWLVVDDGVSRNGTYVNGERIAGRRRLFDGDVLRLGRTEILFRAPGRGESEATATSQDAVRAAGVSPTQRQVMIALCRPFRAGGAFAAPATNQDIADELFLSVGAVKTHLRALFARFGIEDLPQNQKRLRLVEIAFRTGLVSEHDL